jgi:WD repeat-containing protein 19
LDTSSPVTNLEWDPEGTTLAILQNGNNVVSLWDLSSRTTQNLDTNFKDPTFIKWSNTGSQLVIGTQKGNLVLYSKSTRKLVPVLGKHSKRITCGAWNSSDQLVLGADDRMMTLSNSKGDTIEQRELSYIVSLLDPDRPFVLIDAKKHDSNNIYYDNTHSPQKSSLGVSVEIQ